MTRATYQRQCELIARLPDSRAEAELLWTLEGAVIRASNKAASIYGLWGDDADDLRCECRRGALDGIRGFDPAHGVTLLTYAKHWMWKRMRKWIRTQSQSIRPTGDTDRMPEIVSLSAETVKGSGKPIAPLEGMADGSEHPDDVIARQQLAAAIASAVESLRTPRLRAIAIGVSEGRTLASIGAEHGITAERARQLKLRAMNHLRRRLAAEVDR